MECVILDRNEKSGHGPQWCMVLDRSRIVVTDRIAVYGPGNGMCGHGPRYHGPEPQWC